jgi:chaperonin GroES
MAAAKLRPIGDRVLVLPAKEQEVKKGGIIIPDTAKEKPQEGKIIALGTGKTDDSGKKVPFEVKVGDRVVFSKYGGTEIKVDGEEHVILREEDILGVLSNN